MPPSKHHKVSNSGREVSVLVVDLISSRVPKYATQGETQIREISTPSIVTYTKKNV